MPIFPSHHPCEHGHIDDTLDMPITRVVVNYPCQLPGTPWTYLTQYFLAIHVNNLSTYSCSLERAWLKLALFLVDRKPQVFSSRSREPLADGACCSKKVSKEFVVESRKEASRYRSTFQRNTNPQNTDRAADWKKLGYPLLKRTNTPPSPGESCSPAGCFTTANICLMGHLSPPLYG